MTTEIHQREKGRGSRWQDYVPLMVIVALMLLSACAKQFAYGEWNWMSWMHDFMGFFLIVFSMFKFFNMEGFADGFQMYTCSRNRSGLTPTFILSSNWASGLDTFPIGARLASALRRLS